LNAKPYQISLYRPAARSHRRADACTAPLRVHANGQSQVDRQSFALPTSAGVDMCIVRTLQGAIAALAVVLLASGAMAQAPQRPPYGAPINLETAKKIAAGAVAEAKKNNWNVAIAIVDNHGLLVYYEMLDDTQTASANVAIEKARTSATYRRASKEFEDGIAGGRNAILGLPGVTPIEGGLTIVVGGKMIGAIGVSGVTSPQDAQIARAGLDAVK
jgi:glc operon protein GlcG